MHKLRIEFDSGDAFENEIYDHQVELFLDLLHKPEPTLIDGEVSVSGKVVRLILEPLYPDPNPN